MRKKKRQPPFSKASLDRAAQALAENMRDPCGIGEMGEKNLHALFKLAVEPRRENHEVPLCGFVADILNENGVCEIQTRAFARLYRKLEVFLNDYAVAVICPIVTDKEILWVNENGEVLRMRKSPKHGAPIDAAAELYALRALFPHPRLRFFFPLLSVTEYRSAEKDGKTAKRKADRLPTALSGVIAVENTADAKALLPAHLPDTFTAKTFADLIRRPHRTASAALGFFLACGLLDRKKEGRGYLYMKKS